MLLHDLPQPANDMEWKQLYREMGAFFAAKVFINRTPQVVLDLPVADIHEFKSHMRLRAVCDERITLPLKAFRDFPDIYSSLSSSLGQDAAVEVKMAWRCNTEQWWTARLKPEYAGPLYRKLGYPSYFQELQVGELDSAVKRSWTPMLRSRRGRCRPSLLTNVSSIASDSFKRQLCGDKKAHVSWARMECGLVL